MIEAWPNHWGVLCFACVMSIAAFSCVGVSTTPSAAKGTAVSEVDWAPAPAPTALRAESPSTSPRFVVGIAPLRGDTGDQTRRLIVGELRHLGQELEVVRVNEAPRTESISGSTASNYQQLARILASSGAHLLIWGEVSTASSPSSPRLLLATSSGVVLQGESSSESVAAEQHDMPKAPPPDQLWEDLVDMLKLVVLSRANAFDESRYPAAVIEPFVTRARRLVKSSAVEKTWSSDSRWALLEAYGNALATLGWQAGDNVKLEESVTIHRRALLDASREGAPIRWASTQNSLGIALGTLGQRESSTKRLQEAVEALRRALQKTDRERVPLYWAMVQNNLGTALLALGQRERGTKRLEQAVQACRAALAETRPEQMPLEWARAQNNLGTALVTLGQREPGTKRLQEAVKALRAALRALPRRRVPLKWASAQYNLGNALRTIGERETGTERLHEAVDAYRRALLERTRQRVPSDWAATQNNLGIALGRIGERETGTKRLQEAVAAFRAALGEEKRDREPLRWASTQNNLAYALLALGEREASTMRLQEAAEAFHAALAERTRERVPLLWATTQFCLGVILRRLAVRQKRPPCKALELHGEVLALYRERAPQHMDWALDGIRKDLDAPVAPTPASCPGISRANWAEFEAARVVRNLQPSKRPAP